jgi:hypothetical protein
LIGKCAAPAWGETPIIRNHHLIFVYTK